MILNNLSVNSNITDTQCYDLYVLISTYFKTGIHIKYNNQNGIDRNPNFDPLINIDEPVLINLKDYLPSNIEFDLLNGTLYLNKN